MADASKNQTVPSQQFVEISKIQDGVVYLKKGGVRKIIIVSGINFDLKSETEQGLILNGFQDFLNAIDFSVQFFVHSRKVNIDSYVERMRTRREEEPNELLKIQIDEYLNFIKTFIDQNKIISKTFFVVVPYEASDVVEQAKKGVFSFFRKKEKEVEDVPSAQAAVEQLNHRVDQVIGGLEQIGLRAAPLEDDEITELFYNLYNPQLVEKKGIEIKK
jgi:type IV secretory pathway VirB4 component